MRFRYGRTEVDGGWESLTPSLLTGVCRKVFPWTDNSGVVDVAFGTHSNLHLWQGGVLFDITPFGPPAPLGTSPLTTTNTSATVTVSHTGHGYTTGLSLKIFGATDTGGIVAANLNGTRTITVVDANTYTIIAGANATSSVSGGGSAIVVTPQTVLPAGAIDGTGSVGYGTGGFGVGPWGETSATTDYFPRTWSLDAWGQQLVASPRNGGLYAWANNTASRAAGVDGAPSRITNMLVAPMQGGYMLFALGTNQEADGVFNPRTIRHSAIRDYNTWATLTSTSREYTLPGSGDIVAGRMCGAYLLVWTTHELFIGTYTGQLDLPWNFQQIGKNCGLIGPNAVTVKGLSAYWASPDRQFYSYSIGGAPQVIPCPIRTGYADNLAASQGDKIVASVNSEFEEIRFDYPDSSEGFENSRFLRVCVSAVDPGAWSQGIMARTAMVDAGPTRYPLGTTFAGNIYYHEKGNSADGAAFAWSITSAAQLLDVDWRMLIKSIWPDFQGQIGPVFLTISSLEHPQGVPNVLMSGAIAPATERVDLMITGRFFQVTISGNSSPTWMRIGKPVIEVERAGRAV